MEYMYFHYEISYYELVRFRCLSWKVNRGAIILVLVLLAVCLVRQLKIHGYLRARPGISYTSKRKHSYILYKVYIDLFFFGRYVSPYDYRARLIISAQFISNNSSKVASPPFFELTRSHYGYSVGSISRPILRGNPDGFYFRPDSGFLPCR